jgi:DNA-binding NtrC family response regulator
MKRRTSHLSRALLVAANHQASGISQRLADLADVQCRSVGTLEEAEAVIEHKTPHVIVLDYTLCGAAGIETLSILMDALHNRNIPLILITPAVSDWELEQFEQLGVYVALANPFRMSELAQHVKEATKRNGNKKKTSSGETPALR